MTPWRARTGRSGGFTVFELLITLAVLSVVTAISIPRIAAVRGANAVRGARGEVVATVEAARAAAIQRGRRAWIRRNGNVLTAETTDENAARRVVVATARLDELYGALLSTADPGDDLITFDGRGLLNPRLPNGRVARYRVAAKGSPGQRDSVCVSAIGMLLPPGCVP
jgi:prepilin-type N-terminal cleavage/methylation domain-containing protein